MQDAFLKVWERWDALPRLGTPNGYLFQTAMNLFREPPAASLDRRAQGLVAHVIDRRSRDRVEDRDEIVRWLRPLPPRQRAAVVLTTYLDYSADEVARILGHPPFHRSSSGGAGPCRRPARTGGSTMSLDKRDLAADVRTLRAARAGLRQARPAERAARAAEADRGQHHRPRHSRDCGRAHKSFVRHDEACRPDAHLGAAGLEARDLDRRSRGQLGQFRVGSGLAGSGVPVVWELDRCPDDVSGRRSDRVSLGGATAHRSGSGR